MVASSGFRLTPFLSRGGERGEIVNLRWPYRDNDWEFAKYEALRQADIIVIEENETDQQDS